MRQLDNNSAQRLTSERAFLAALVFVFIFVLSIRVPAADRCESIFVLTGKSAEVKGLSPLGNEWLLKVEKEFSQQENIFGVPKGQLVRELSEDRDLQWIAQDVIHDRVQVAINQPPNVRDLIVQSGIKNQFETGRSSAKFDLRGRERTEAKYLGVAQEDYANLPLTDRPKYGYVAPVIGSKLKRDSAADGYGPDTYFLKKEHFAHRLTWVPGDSLDNQFATIGQSETPIMRERFIPWSEHSLMLSFLKPPEDNPVAPTELQITAPGEWYRHTDKGTVFCRHMDTNQSYIEVQIWGKVSLDDVAAFSFRESPPSGAFLEALQKRKVPIYQNVGGKDRLWWSAEMPTSH